MSKSQKYKLKTIKVSIKNSDDTKVKVDFTGGVFSPQEFTAMFMAVLETYTLSLLETNEAKDIYNHFNSVFGIYLNKLLPEEDIYNIDENHKKFKKFVDSTLLQPEDKKDTENNRFAAYLLTRDILTKEVGLTEEAADVLLNKRLGLVAPKEIPNGEKQQEEKK